MATPREVTARIDAMFVSDAEAHYLLGYLTQEDPDLMDQLLDLIEEKRRGTPRNKEGGSDARA